jgi:hypothetical protein
VLPLTAMLTTLCHRAGQECARVYEKLLENDPHPALNNNNQTIGAYGVDSQARRVIALFQGCRQTVSSGGGAAAEFLTRTCKFKRIRRCFLPCFCAASFSRHARQA